MNKSIILLSGGVDSAVSLAMCKEKENIELALFFNYGHKSFIQEKKAVEKLCKYYDIKLEIIDLPWLKAITKTALVAEDENIPELKNNELDNKNITENSAKKVWVPNRNGVFINIAGAYADSFGYNKIIIGANKEEGETFPDNSKDFINSATETLKFSTQVKAKVIAPLIDLNKCEIMLVGKSLNFPFEMVRSCYTDNETHCGECESCKRLKRGLTEAGLSEIANLMFTD